MKNIFFLLTFLTCQPSLATDIKISQLPLGTASTTSTADSFPYVNATTATTERLTLYDLPNIPTMVSTYVPLLNPTFPNAVTFSSSVTAQIFIGPLTGTASGNTTITPSQYGVVVSGAANVLSTVAPGSVGYPLISNGAASNPIYGQVSLTSAVTGTLGPGNGALGLANPTAHGVLLGEGTSPAVSSVGSAGTVHQGQGSSSDPIWTMAPTLGNAGVTTGSVLLAAGITSGAAVSVANLAATTAYNFNLPTTAGAVGQFLASGGGGVGTSSVMTWANGLSNPMSLANEMIYGGASGLATATNAGTAGMLPMVNSGATAISLVSIQGNSVALKAPTLQILSTLVTTTASITSASTCLSGVTSLTGIVANAPIQDESVATFVTPGTYVVGTGVGSCTGVTMSANATSTGTTHTFYFGGVYTTPTNPAPLYLHVRMCGGGGGGGSLSNGNFGATGGYSSFAATGTVNYLSTAGGAGGTNTTANGSIGGLGGLSTIGAGPLGIAAQGQGGQSGVQLSASQNGAGGDGGGSYFGSGGLGGSPGAGASSATNNTCGGGGGSGAQVSGSAGSGGGAGGFIDANINSPASTYSFIDGYGGLPITVTAAQKGGSGGSGVIYVEEHYQ